MPKAYDKQTPSESELEMAKTLMHLMIEPFDHSAYRNEYQERVNEMIEKKILGEKIIIAPQPAEHSIANLMESLSQSVARAEEKEQDAVPV